MTETVEPIEENSKKKSKLPMILGFVFALTGGAGGFFAVATGLLFAPKDQLNASVEDSVEPIKPVVVDITFIPMEPLIISLGAAAQNRHLRFRAQLEVPNAYKSDVETIMPRIIDVLNNYLRALGPEDFEHPAALIRLRAQMLKRIQIVTGTGRVRDLLIMEFVLN